MHIHKSKINVIAKTLCIEDFPGGPVADSALPVQGAWVQSLVRELDPAYHNKTQAEPNKQTKNLSSIRVLTLSILIQWQREQKLT